MVVAVVYAFAVADGLMPVVGAAPYDVLARQLPRMLVVRLNGTSDRGIRFFPFMGTIDGKRGFLRLRERFTPSHLLELHKQGDAQLVCDGVFQGDALLWRAIDGATGRVLREVELPFDPTQPTDVLPRLEFEVMEMLGWGGRPQGVPALAGETLGWWLILKDALLRREAGLVDEQSDPLRSVRRCAELAHDDPEVVEVILDYCAHLLRANEWRDDVAEILRAVVDAPELPVTQFERLGAMLLSAGDEQTAGTATLRAARGAIDRTELIERCVGLLFRLERFVEAADLVEQARQRGVASVTAIAQYAACCDRLGDRQTRSELCDELLLESSLPSAVARLLVSFLLEDERPEPARQVAARTLQEDPSQSVMHFELGRACLALDDCRQAVAALKEAIDRGLPNEHEIRARRLLRLASRPGLWRQSQNVEIALAANDLDAAFAAVVPLARGARSVAEAWFLVGLVRHKRGQTQRAERALRRALRLDDTLPDAHNRLGILLVSLNRVDEGLSCLERAHELAPTEAVADAAPRAGAGATRSDRRSQRTGGPGRGVWCRRRPRGGGAARDPVFPAAVALEPVLARDEHRRPPAFLPRPLPDPSGLQLSHQQLARSRAGGSPRQSVAVRR